MKLILTFLLSLALIQGASAAVLDDFERETPEIPNSPAVKLSLVEAVTGPVTGPASGKALAVDWNFPHSPWIEFAYPKPRVAIEKEPLGLLGLRLEAWLPASPGISSFGVRLTDSQNEIFQWGAKIQPSTEAGWRSITIPLDVESSNSHWGGNNNGRIEYPLKLSGYAMVFANAQVPAGRAMIDQVRIEPLPQVSLETDRFPFLVNATGKAKCDLVFSNPEDRAVTIALNGKLTAYSGAPVELTGTIILPPNGVSRFEVPLGERQAGIRNLDCQLKFGQGEINYKTSFVIADPVKRTNGKNDFIFGICSHTENQPESQREAEFQAAAAAGANVMRVGAAWASLEPKPGEWKWDVQDKLVELGAKYGIEIQLILGFGPSHAVSQELQTQQATAYKNKERDPWKISLFGPPEEAPWRRYVSTVATRYKGRIRLYEIWNEPDLGFWRGTTEQYLNLLRVAHEELRRADPDALVLTGGFATVLEHAGRAKNPDLQERVLTEAIDSFDVHAIHQHGPFKEFEGAVEGELKRIRAVMPKAKPLYFNETAIAAFGNEKAQASTLVKKMAYVMAQGAMGYNWYDLRNDGINPAEPEHNYGLLTSSLRPKAAYASYLELVRRLQGLRPLGRLDFGSAREAYAFGGPRGRVVVWWNEQSNAGSIPVLYRSNGAVRSIDLMGNMRELPSQEGIVLAQSSNEPQYLEFPAGQGVPEVVGELVKVEGPKEALVGLPLALNAVVRNPLAREIKANLSWRSPNGKDTSSVVTVAPKSSGNLTINATTPGNRALTAELDVNFSVENMAWSGTARYLAPVTRVISTSTPENRPPDWVIDKRWEMVSLTGADPSMTALNWRDSNDLSASVWLWQQENALKVRVDVQDDIHVQKEAAQEIWRGDSVQLALQSSGEKKGWEIGAAQNEEGQILKGVWETPVGDVNSPELFTATCQTIPGGARYEFTLPDEEFNLIKSKNTLFFNLIVNDNDGTVREGFARLAPGMGVAKDVNLFPVLRFP